MSYELQLETGLWPFGWTIELSHKYKYWYSLGLTICIDCFSTFAGKAGSALCYLDSDLVRPKKKTSLKAKSSKSKRCINNWMGCPPERQPQISDFKSKLWEWRWPRLFFEIPLAGDAFKIPWWGRFPFCARTCHSEWQGHSESFGDASMLFS